LSGDSRSRVEAVRKIVAGTAAAENDLPAQTPLLERRIGVYRTTGCRRIFYVLTVCVIIDLMDLVPTAVSRADAMGPDGDCTGSEWPSGGSPPHLPIAG